MASLRSRGHETPDDVHRILRRSPILRTDALMSLKCFMRRIACAWNVYATETENHPLKTTFPNPVTTTSLSFCSPRVIARRRRTAIASLSQPDLPGSQTRNRDPHSSHFHSYCSHLRLLPSPNPTRSSTTHFHLHPSRGRTFHRQALHRQKKDSLHSCLRLRLVRRRRFPILLRTQSLIVMRRVGSFLVNRES